MARQAAAKERPLRLGVGEDAGDLIGQGARSVQPEIARLLSRQVASQRRLQDVGTEQPAFETDRQQWCVDGMHCLAGEPTRAAAISVRCTAIVPQRTSARIATRAATLATAAAAPPCAGAPRPTDRLTDRPTDRLTDRPVDRSLTDRPTDRLTGH